MSVSQAARIPVLTAPQHAAPLKGAIVACLPADARAWAGVAAGDTGALAPALARRMRDQGAHAVCIVGVAQAHAGTLTWLDSAHARGWLAPGAAGAAPTDARRFATNLSEALARGFVAADAAVLATMAYGAERDDFVDDPRRLPLLSWSEQAVFAARRPSASRSLGLYAIVDSAQRVEQVAAAGVRTVQLRIKKPASPDASWHAALRGQIRMAIAAAQAAGAEFYVNDHWQLACELGAAGVHLGQEDLVGMSDGERAALAASGIALGVSSHSLWELCRAHALAPRYVACGPVWPTVTKDMPWIAQGMDNLTWWCRMAQAPVVAIGGIVGPEEVRQAARCGADGVCIVRGLGERPCESVPPLHAALKAGRRDHGSAPMAPRWPHPSLSAG